MQHRMAKDQSAPRRRITLTTNQLIFSSFPAVELRKTASASRPAHTSQAGNCIVGYAANTAYAKLFSACSAASSSSKEYPTNAASFNRYQEPVPVGF